ncbi:hypothetical protein BWZ20_08330 [Winogradskyella sp. J14-2]|nr:hypothetical protein BWZ20_08330 [Winogradskyella sp. J14-2]
MLDLYYITVFNYYKRSFKRQSHRIALFYINLLEISIYSALGAFFLAFSKQMKLVTMSLSKFWILFVLISTFIVFKNWMRYNGKKRNVLNAKSRTKRSIFFIWFLPLACLGLTFIFFQVL